MSITSSAAVVASTKIPGDLAVARAVEDAMGHIAQATHQLGQIVPERPLVSAGAPQLRMVASTEVLPKARDAFDNLLLAVKKLLDTEDGEASGFRDALEGVGALRVLAETHESVPVAAVRHAESAAAALHREFVDNMPDVHAGLLESWLDEVDPKGTLDQKLEDIAVARYRELGGNPDDM